jgi:hypothetical protein
LTSEYRRKERAHFGKCIPDVGIGETWIKIMLDLVEIPVPQLINVFLVGSLDSWRNELLHQTGFIAAGQKYHERDHHEISETHRRACFGSDRCRIFGGIDFRYVKEVNHLFALACIRGTSQPGFFYRL